MGEILSEEQRNFETPFIEPTESGGFHLVVNCGAAGRGSDNGHEAIKVDTVDEIAVVVAQQDAANVAAERVQAAAYEAAEQARIDQEMRDAADGEQRRKKADKILNNLRTALEDPNADPTLRAMAQLMGVIPPPE